VQLSDIANDIIGSNTLGHLFQVSPNPSVSLLDYLLEQVVVGDMKKPFPSGCQQDKKAEGDSSHCMTCNTQPPPPFHLATLSCLAWSPGGNAVDLQKYLLTSSETN
jgi:hypothetical protein